MDVLIAALVLGAVGSMIYLVAEARGGIESAPVSSDPAQIISLAMAQIQGGPTSFRASWVSVEKSDRSASFVYKQRPSILAALAMLLFFVVPGVLYLIFGSKDQTLQIDVLGTGSNTYTVQMVASGGFAYRRGRRFVEQIADRPLKTQTENSATTMQAETADRPLASQRAVGQG